MEFWYERRNQTLTAYYGRGLSSLAHLHSHLELVYMVEGEAVAYLENQSYILQEGDLFLTFPNQIHSYQEGGSGLHLLIIAAPELMPEFQTLFFQHIPVSPVCRRVGDNARLDRLLRDIQAVNDPDCLYNDTEMKGLLLAAFSELFRQMRFEAVSSADNNVVRDILTYCAANYTGDLQLDTVAQALHVNKYYISHLFTQKLHLRFNEYVGMLRISAAQQLLDEGKSSITDIAYSVGFNSPRTFNRLFLKYRGVSPRDYRASRNSYMEKAGDTE